MGAAQSGCWKPNSSTQEEQQVLLSAEASLRPHKLLLKQSSSCRGRRAGEANSLSRSMTRTSRCTCTGTLVGDSPELGAPDVGEQRADLKGVSGTSRAHVAGSTVPEATVKPAGLGPGVQCRPLTHSTHSFHFGHLSGPDTVPNPIPRNVTGPCISHFLRPGSSISQPGSLS